MKLQLWTVLSAAGIVLAYVYLCVRIGASLALRDKVRESLAWTGPRFRADHVEAVAAAASVLISFLIAAALYVSLLAALALVVLVGMCAIVARFGLLGIAFILVTALPWLVVLHDVEPALTETFTAGGTVVVLLLVAAPKNDGSKASNRLRVGMILFFVPVVIGLRHPGGPQFIQAAKYLVFPFTVLAVTDGTNRPALGKLSRIALVSGAAAITVNLLLGSAGLNHSYYQAGDIEGLGGEHDVSLLAGAVTAASLGMTAVGRWAPVSAIGAIATIATGVRSTLPGLLLAALARISRAGARGRTLFVVAVAVVAVYASGVANVVVDRFAHGQQTGEFASLSTFGSGRGAIYATAIHAWWSSSPVDWFFGTGLRTLPGIEDRALGESLVGHSDVVEVGVQTGLIGLVGLILMWWTLIARARSKLPLLVLVPFSLFNGILEYGAPLVVALLLTARSDGGAAELDGGGEPRAAPWHDPH